MLFLHAGVQCVRHRCVVPQALPIPLPFPHIFPDDHNGSAQGGWCNGITQGAVLSTTKSRSCPHNAGDALRDWLLCFGACYVVWRTIWVCAGGQQTVILRGFGINPALHVACVQGQMVRGVPAAINRDPQMVQPASPCFLGSAPPRPPRMWPRHSWIALKVRR